MPVMMQEYIRMRGKGLPGEINRLKKAFYAGEDLSFKAALRIEKDRSR